jgi:hypothetical protein
VYGGCQTKKGPVGSGSEYPMKGMGLAQVDALDGQVRRKIVGDYVPTQVCLKPT